MLDGHRLKVRLLRKDQYGRAVAEVFVPRFGRRRLDAADAMLKVGLAEVYQGGGAVYGPKGLDHYLALERQAREAKRGVWQLGGKRESAANYKRRTKGS